jgi:mono/diheme cytochrome c family protein
MRRFAGVTALVAACGLVACGRKPVLEARVVPLGDAHTGSAVVVTKVGEREIAYVADEDDATVHVVDLQQVPFGDPLPTRLSTGPAEVAAVPVPGRPGQLLALPDGRLLVAIRGGSEVAVLRIQPLDLGKLKAEPSLRTPLEPVGLATTPDGKSLLVTSGWGHALTEFDVATGREQFQVSLPRDPRAVVTSSDGSKAFVSHAVGSSLSVVDLRDPGHSVIASSVDGWSSQSQPFEGRRHMRMMKVSEGFFEDTVGGLFVPEEAVHPRKACQGFTLARVDGPSERILAPQVEVETGDPTARSSGYGSGMGIAAEVPNVAVVPVDTGMALPASMEVFQTTRSFGRAFDVGPEEESFRSARRRRQEHRPCVLPRAAATSGHRLYVACLGIDSIVEYDADVVAPARVEERRWSVPAGPEGLALVGSNLYVWSQFARTLTVLDVSDPPESESPTADSQDTTVSDLKMTATASEASADEVRPVQVALSRLAAPPSGGDLALGRELFHSSGDPRISRDGRACASCHPDGRDDSLTWSTPTGPRQTPMLAGRIQDTAPYGWDGDGKDVTMHLTHTFERLSGSGLKTNEVAALIAYVRSLPVPPRENEARQEDARVARGRELFHAKEADCASCHSDGALADGMTHDVQSKLDADAKAEFDTPSLRFVAGTGPYFHDGRYATLRDVLTHTEGQMGNPGHLSGEDLDALEAYVETL